MPIRKEKVNKLSLTKVVSGGFWLYLDTILVSLIGYIYWLIIGRISGPDILGYASATLSIAWIAQTVILLGIPTGIQRFLGKSYGFGNYSSLKRYFLTSLTFLFLIVIVSVVSLWYFDSFFSCLINIDSIYIFLAGFLILFTGINLIFKSFLISTLRVDRIFIFDAIANLIRLGAGIYLVILGYSGVGAVLGYVLSGLVSLILFSTYTFKQLHKIKIKTPIIDLSALKEILNASYVNWLPTLITTIGIQLGILVIFGSHGAMETGIYFLAFSIFGVLLALPNTFLSILFPVLSGLEIGHAQSTRRAMNLILAAATPLSVAMAVYSEFLLGLVGPAYTVGWFVLTVLAISVPFMCIVSGVNSLVYALGNYRAVLVIGSAMSFMRVVLYFYLVPQMGNLGAAYAFDVGVIAAFLSAIYYGRKSDLYIDWKRFLLTLLVPGAIGIPLFIFKIPWYIGVVGIVGVSEIIFARARIYTKEDIRDISVALLPKDVVRKIAPKVYPILELLFGE